MHIYNHRCINCFSVVDKYVEFEIIIIAIDVILHKIQAYRHILFNRNLFLRPIDLRLIFFVNIALCLLFKCATLYHSAYSVNRSIFLFCSVICDHFALVFILLLCVVFRPNQNYTSESIYFHQLYIAVSFPILGKIPVLLLQTWDHEISLLILSNILTISVEYISIKCVASHLSEYELSSILISAIAFRLCSRILFHPLDEILKLGIIWFQIGRFFCIAICALFLFL